MNGANLAWRSGEEVAGGGFAGMGDDGDTGEVDGSMADWEGGGEESPVAHGT